MAMQANAAQVDTARPPLTGADGTVLSLGGNAIVGR